MGNTFTKFKLTALGACLTTALAVGAVSTTVSASDHSNEVRAAQAAKISLQQAITTASRDASGILVSADFDDDDDRRSNSGVYELEFQNDSTSYEFTVDATTGQIVESESERLDRDDIEEYNVQQQAKIKAVDAIEIAEKHSNGRVLDIEFEDDNISRADHYEVKILKDSKISQLHIDANTGAVN
ncbi:PepSY domain-containing protein [Psychrobacter sp.]|uniref:PepSY domain-containing protein n=1 Tax=Psychrobacter sp. TaxID=56811 RepID=UPI0026494068|nr:PepSY domain-containing protein [Psychrobacter sp.]MDN6275326.1 PepSY domain-containing protein [Psychrobacter sp.]MDN6308330.1 PepSY domain-containing protein [Psychrobacter sp.]